jgi:small subunit ribosomal protein S6
MIKYESVFIIDATQDEETIKGLIEKIKTLVEKSAQLESIDEWGKRRLAYPINDLTDGYYTLMLFSAPPDFPQELERIYKITEGIIRYMVIKKEV